MAHTRKAAVLLAGCGHMDGAEIRESVLTLLALDQHGAEFQCIAPNAAQSHVINHATGQVAENASRNILEEASRIARFGRVPGPGPGRPRRLRRPAPARRLSAWPRTTAASPSRVRRRRSGPTWRPSCRPSSPRRSPWAPSASPRPWWPCAWPRQGRKATLTLGDGADIQAAMEQLGHTFKSVASRPGDRHRRGPEAGHHSGLHVRRGQAERCVGRHRALRGRGAAPELRSLDPAEPLSRSVLQHRQSPGPGHPPQGGLGELRGGHEPFLHGQDLDPGSGLTQHQAVVRQVQGPVHGPEDLVRHRLRAPATREWARASRWVGGTGGWSRATTCSQLSRGCWRKAWMTPVVPDLPDHGPQWPRGVAGQAAALAGAHAGPPHLEALDGHRAGLRMGGGVLGDGRQRTPGQPRQEPQPEGLGSLAVLGDPAQQHRPPLEVLELRRRLQPAPGRRRMPQHPQEVRPGDIGGQGPFHGQSLCPDSVKLRG